MVKFLDLYSQYEEIGSDIDQVISSVIRESAFIGGKYVSNFEEHFADYQCAAHCVGVANGTDAIEIALEALQLPKGSEIIVPANSFIATSEAVTRAGYQVRFCACDTWTYTIDMSDVREKVTPQTSAIIAVHLYGHPCDMDAVLSFAQEHDLRVIEDCAQAHGAEYKGKRVGGLGDIGTFSFYPGKVLGAYGDGGAVVTNDASLAKHARMIANHGRMGKYNHEFEGRNSRLDGLQAAILDVKLSSLEKWIDARISVADIYDRTLTSIDELVLPVRQSWVRHVYHLYVIRCLQRDELQKYLSSRGIQTGIHYPCALPQLDAYRYLEQTTRTDDLNNNLLSLPIGEHLSENDIAVVVDAIGEFYS